MDCKLISCGWWWVCQYFNRDVVPSAFQCVYVCIIQASFFFYTFPLLKTACLKKLHLGDKSLAPQKPMVQLLQLLSNIKSPWTDITLQLTIASPQWTPAWLPQCSLCCLHYFVFKLECEVGQWTLHPFLYNTKNMLFLIIWGYKSLEVKGQSGLLLPPASSSQQSNHQGLPILHLGSSTPPWVSFGCAGASFANSSCPLSWSSGLGGGSPTHALLQRLLHHPPHIDTPVFLQSCLQSLFGISNVDLAAATWYTIYHIRLLTKRWFILHLGQHWAGRPTTLILNFLQTQLMSLLIPATYGITTSGPYSSSCSSSGLLMSAVSCVGGTEALQMKFTEYSFCLRTLAMWSRCFAAEPTQT